jgi:hypothetical protein
MGSKFIVVVGDGETTRNNVEALFEDFFYKKSKDYILLLPFIGRPSQGQVLAHQVFQELGMQTTALAPDEAMIFNLGSASLNTVNDPISAAIEAVKGEEAYVFALVTEDGQIDLTGFTEAQVPCYNLCRGLMAINAVEVIQRPIEAKIQAVQTPLPGPSELSANIAELVGGFSNALMEVLRKHGAVK